MKGVGRNNLPFNQMKKFKSTVLIFFTLLLFLTGCASGEQLELGAWKENLQEGTITSTIKNNDDTDSVKTEENSIKQEAATSESQISFYDFLQNMGESLTNQVIEETVGNKYTVEESGLVKVKLLRVVDGDTLLVNYTGEEYVRMIGINTPESVHPDEQKNTSEGMEASNHTKELLADTEYVWLEFDTDMYDGYDRMLVYVWLSNDTSNPDNMLNVQLLQNGAAELMTIEPNVKYAEVFSAAIK